MQGITLAFLFSSLLSAQDPYRYLPALECREFDSCLRELTAQAGPAKVVATTVYLADIADYAAMNRAYERYFAPDLNDGLKPARNTIQARLPNGQRMSLNAILYDGPARLQGLTPPGVTNLVPITPAIRTPDRLFIAGILGRDSNSGAIPSTPAAQIDLCLSRLANVLKTAHVAPSQVLQLTVYHTASIPRPPLEAALSAYFGPNHGVAFTILEVPALALGAQVGLNGIADASRDYFQDVTSIDRLLAALFASISGPAGQARDWDRLRYLLHPTARFQAVRPQGGIATLTVDDYIARNARALVEQGFYEIETSRKLEVYEAIAHALVGFAIKRTPDGPVLRTGTNSLQLYWDGTRWWVMNIYWDNAR